MAKNHTRQRSKSKEGRRNNHKPVNQIVENDSAPIPATTAVKKNKPHYVNSSNGRALACR